MSFENRYPCYRNNELTTCFVRTSENVEDLRPEKKCTSEKLQRSIYLINDALKEVRKARRRIEKVFVHPLVRESACEGYKLTLNQLIQDIDETENAYLAATGSPPNLKTCNFSHWRQLYVTAHLKRLKLDPFYSISLQKTLLSRP